MQPSATGTDRASERQQRKETDRVSEREREWKTGAGNIHPHNVRLSQSFSINLSAISCEHKGRSYAMWTH